VTESSSTFTCRRSILFADVVGSVALYEELGNVVARKKVGSCLKLLTDTTRRFGGHVVKSLGDGILCSFASELPAAQAAMRMCDQSVEAGVDIHVGVHCGEVLESAGDVFGDTVNTASRIASLAKPLEILISRPFRDALPAVLQRSVREVRPITVRGKTRALELYAILRDGAGLGDNSPNQTIAIAPLRRPSGDGAREARLELSFAGRLVTATPGGGLTLGRNPASDVEVPGKSVSRDHARIFHRQGKYVLQDQSANGSWVVPRGQPKIYLLREEAILIGAGRIYLGTDPEDRETAPIRYRNA